MSSSSPSCLLSSSSPPLTSPLQEDVETSDWKGLLILIPVRLGVDELNPLYIDSLLRCLEIPQSLGFVGGRQRSSLYFIGYQSKKLLYLDPHTTQSVVSELKADTLQPSYHCATAATLDVKQIDPSLALGFFCTDEKDFREFWEHAKEISQMPYPAFSIADTKPSYVRQATDILKKELKLTDSSSDDEDFLVL